MRRSHHQPSAARTRSPVAANRRRPRRAEKGAGTLGGRARAAMHDAQARQSQGPLPEARAGRDETRLRPPALRGGRPGRPAARTTRSSRSGRRSARRSSNRSRKPASSCSRSMTFPKACGSRCAPPTRWRISVGNSAGARRRSPRSAHRGRRVDHPLWARCVRADPAAGRLTATTSAVIRRQGMEESHVRKLECSTVQQTGDATPGNFHKIRDRSQRHRAEGSARPRTSRPPDTPSHRPMTIWIVVAAVALATTVAAAGVSRRRAGRLELSDRDFGRVSQSWLIDHRADARTFLVDVSSSSAPDSIRPPLVLTGGAHGRARPGRDHTSAR